MATEIKIKIPSNLKTVNVNDLGELVWWSVHLGIGPERLLSIIDKIGNSAEKIRKEKMAEKVVLLPS